MFCSTIFVTFSKQTKKKSFMVRFGNYKFCMPSFNSQKCSFCHHRSLNHSVGTPSCWAYGKLVLIRQRFPAPPAVPSISFAILSQGCTGTMGRIATSYPGNPEEGKKRWWKRCISCVGHAGEISQQTKKMVGEPGVHEKNTHGTRDEGTWAGRGVLALVVWETS